MLGISSPKRNAQKLFGMLLENLPFGEAKINQVVKTGNK